MDNELCFFNFESNLFCYGLVENIYLINFFNFSVVREGSCIIGYIDLFGIFWYLIFIVCKYFRFMVNIFILIFYEVYF